MWVRALLVTATGVVSMAILACFIALVRDSTGHAWYAAGKLTLAEILIETGFDERASTEYRTADGAILTVTRDDLKFNGEALLARDRLLRTATLAAELGAWCSFGGALLCLALIRRPEGGRGIRRAAFDPNPVQRPEARERFAPPSARPGFVALPPAATVPVRASEDRAARSDVGRPAKPGSVDRKRGEPGSGKEDAPAPRSPPKGGAVRDPGKPPPKGADAGRAAAAAPPAPAGRKRKYGRWI